MFRRAHGVTSAETNLIVDNDCFSLGLYASFPQLSDLSVPSSPPFDPSAIVYIHSLKFPTILQRSCLQFNCGYLTLMKLLGLHLKGVAMM